MDLYIIRHGLAGQHGDYADDTQRPLTDEGKRKTRQVAKRLYELGLRFDLMLTSPLLRASQTAETLQSEKLTKQLETVDYLAPGGDIQPFLSWLETQRSIDKTLAIVGHEPSLSGWAELLIWGEVRQTIVLKKAGAIGVSIPDRGAIRACCQLFWLTPPKFLL